MCIVYFTVNTRDWNANFLIFIPLNQSSVQTQTPLCQRDMRRILRPKLCHVFYQTLKRWCRPTNKYVRIADNIFSSVKVLVCAIKAIERHRIGEYHLYWVHWTLWSRSKLKPSYVQRSCDDVWDLEPKKTLDTLQRLKEDWVGHVFQTIPATLPHTHFHQLSKWYLIILEHSISNYTYS